MGRESTDFGARLRGLRQKAGLTQEDLADRAGLSVNGISALERGTRRQPYPHTVRMLADALGLSELERATLLRLAVPRNTAGEAQRPALPEATTSLLGRDADLALLRKMLGEPGVRLLTLNGPGGSRRPGGRRAPSALARPATRGCRRTASPASGSSRWRSATWGAPRLSCTRHWP